MFAFVSTVTTVSNDPVSNGGSILVVIIKIIFIFSTSRIVLQRVFSKINPSFFLKIKAIFSKTYPSFLTLKEGSTSLLGLLPSGKKRKPLLLVALNRCALRLAGHQSPRQGGCAGWDRLAESLAGSLAGSGASEPSPGLF